MLIYFFYHYDLCLINLPAPVVNEAIKYIMHTSIGAKLFICKLDYFLKVDEPSTTVESPNKGHFGTNINSSGLSTI